MEIWHKRMKELRTNSDTTLKDMAKIIGVSEATVQRYECGKIQEVPYNVIIAYAEKFHVTPSYIMGWSATPTQKQNNVFDIAGDKETADKVREEQFDYRFETEYKTTQKSLTKEEIIVIEGYRELSDDQKELMKRMVNYYERLANYDKDVHRP